MMPSPDPNLPVDFRAKPVFDKRRADWRVGHLIYQVFVDRFAPSARLESKRHCYPEPITLRKWDETPGYGKFLPDHRVHENEVQFWGGDLESLHANLNYIADLGVDVLYLNPIFHAFSNHKYDAMDYFTIDPQYGTREELTHLVTDARRRGIRTMLDGVFNHMGRRAALFAKAADPAAPEREMFTFREEAKNGYLGWRNVANLPEIRLESEAVRRMVYDSPGSVVQSYIREVGVMGWRLDVAPDVGFEHLRGITEASRAAHPEAVVIGECWNYPDEWLRVMDGVMNMHARTLLIELTLGRISARRAGKAIERMIEDGGIEGILRSHMVLDNHDVPRLATTIPDQTSREFIRTLQFLLPGCPVVYYGSELGMEGGADPANRAPMRWDLVSDDNWDLAHTRKLIALRKENDALRVGDFRLLDGEGTLAFLRLTDRARETILVLANPSNAPVHEVIQVRDSRFMDAAPLECLISGDRVTVHCGFIEQSLPPKSIRVFRTVDQGTDPGYSMFKRV